LEKEEISARGAVEKTRRGKVQKPTSAWLGNPANFAGFPLSPSLGGGWGLTQNRTFHVLQKPDILISYQQEATT